MELYALRQVLEVHAASQIPLPCRRRGWRLVAVQRKHDAAVADGDARRVFRSNQRSQALAPSPPPTSSDTEFGSTMAASP